MMFLKILSIFLMRHNIAVGPNTDLKLNFMTTYEVLVKYGMV
jgi:hypothetical protein